MSTDFTVTNHTTEAGPVLVFIGELDAVSSPAVLAAIQTLALTRGQLLVLDLAGLEFCDSSGISALIAARNRATDADAQLALAAVPARLDRTFNLIGLKGVFSTYPTARDAYDTWTTPTAEHPTATPD
ncbi:STAS domain-containing protein [Nocardia sp. XZ_19_369]|uniref:STAS domain-containing protein n=1 Tax=Nocardia sp. XZ_19_369 TaxID=2769487 RepID=UPI0018903870|nr:STAS domain-containing protein [Nocardia sp. XZ_19_369]